MKLIVDTNVAVVANARSGHAAPRCVLTCARKVNEITREHVLVLDDNWQILTEYKANLHVSGEPGVGDAFLKWVLTNSTNPSRCECVPVARRTTGHASGGATDPDDFTAFPEDGDLDGFDRSDRKFVAVCLSHPERPPIMNAVDTDWWSFREALERHGVRVEFLCPDAMSRSRSRSGGPGAEGPG